MTAQRLKSLLNAFQTHLPDTSRHVSKGHTTRRAPYGSRTGRSCAGVKSLVEQSMLHVSWGQRASWSNAGPVQLPWHHLELLEDLQ